jgi:hypothetical protein
MKITNARYTISECGDVVKLVVEANTPAGSLNIVEECSDIRHEDGLIQGIKLGGNIVWWYDPCKKFEDNTDPAQGDCDGDAEPCEIPDFGFGTNCANGTGEARFQKAMKSELTKTLETWYTKNERALLAAIAKAKAKKE